MPLFKCSLANSLTDSKNCDSIVMSIFVNLGFEVENMKRTLTEQKVLDRLDISDWRHLTKDKVIDLATMLPKMDPEVAKSALAQFPEFSKTSLELVHDYKEIFLRVLDDCSDDNRAMYDIYNRMLDNLDEILHRDGLSFEQEMDVMEQMRKISDAAAQFTKEDKQFKAAIATLAMIGVITIGGFLASSLGVDLKVDKIADNLKRLQ